MSRAARPARRVMPIVFGAIVGTYALFTAWGCATVLMMRNGIAPPLRPNPETMGSFVGVLLTLPSWQMLLWVAAVACYAAAAWRLFTGRRGAQWYAAGLAFDLSFLVLLKRAGAVHAEPGRIDLDYVTAALTVVLGLLLWWFERRATSRTAQPVTKA